MLWRAARAAAGEGLREGRRAGLRFAGSGSAAATAAAAPRRAGVRAAQVGSFKSSEGTVGTWFDGCAERFEHNDALLVPGVGLHLTFADCAKHVQSLGNGIADLDRTTGWTCVSFLPQVPETAMTAIAFPKARGSVTFANPAALGSGERFAAAMQTAGARGPRATIFAGEDRMHRSEFALMREYVPELAWDTFAGDVVKSKKFPELRWCIHLAQRREHGFAGYREILTPDVEPAPLVRRARETRSTDVALRFLGEREQVRSTLTQGEVGSGAAAVAAGLGLSWGERVLLAVPLWQPEGALVQLACLEKGACAVLAGPHFDAVDTLRLVGRMQASCLVVTAAQAADILEQPGLAELVPQEARRLIVIGEPSRRGEVAAVAERLASVFPALDSTTTWTLA